MQFFKLKLKSKQTFYSQIGLLFCCGLSLFFFAKNYKLFNVKSGSMEPGVPTFCKILVDRSTQNYQRWDAILFNPPLRPHENQVKRIIGLPGEKLEVLDGNFYHRSNSQWKILRKPSKLQEKGSFWLGPPLFEEVFYYQKNKKKWERQKIWEGWDLKGWQKSSVGYQGKGQISYSLPPWAIFERPGGMRSDQRTYIKVLERPHGEVRFRLKIETEGNITGILQEAQHQLHFQIKKNQAQLAVQYLWSSPKPAPEKKIFSINRQKVITLEFGNYDDLAYLKVNGERVEIPYHQDPFQEEEKHLFQFSFSAATILSEVHVDMDNAYKKEIEGTIETQLRANPEEYFVCGDNTLTARIQVPPQGEIDIGLSHDSRTWEKVRVTSETNQVVEYEDEMAQMLFYQKGKSRYGPKIEFGICAPALPKTHIKGKVIAVLPENFYAFYFYFLIVLFYFCLDLLLGKWLNSSSVVERKPTL